MKSKSRFSLSSIKLLLKSLYPYRLECPTCMGKGNFGKDPYMNTVVVRSMWDEKYHTYKFYAHCKDCNYTTPAFPTLQEVINHVEMNWVLVEDETLGINEFTGKD